MKLNPLTLLEKLINEHGSAKILGERLLLLKDEISKIEKERTDLTKKCSNLEKEITKLRTQLQQKTIPNEFVEHLGVFFKRNTDGSYLPIPYCPECKRPLFNVEPNLFPWSCNKPGCGFVIKIHEDIQSISEKLKEKHS